MKIFTEKQIQFLFNKNIKINSFYSFPSYDFYIYSEPKYSSGELMEINPFTRSLNHEFFLVKSKENGFYKGNFLHKQNTSDFYLSEIELSKRSAVEFLLLSTILFIPFISYNLIIKAINKRIKNKSKL